MKINFKQIANETLKIINDVEYEVNGQCVKLPQPEQFSTVDVFSPERGEAFLDKFDTKKYEQKKMCNITVTGEDSFEAANRFDYPMVLNFASARHPGGGFLKGASAQEESFCRCSTLFASLSSKDAKAMYEYNKFHSISTYSEFMLFSPHVVVFRDAKCGLLEKPFVVSVASVPAPNRSAGARFETDETIREVLLRRIRRMLIWAVKNGNKNLVPGAWGCGVFKNDPYQVASCFRQVLVDEGYGYCFDDVCFAVYGKPNNRNLAAFKEVFAY